MDLKAKDQIDRYKREVRRLSFAVENLTENKKVLEQTCIEQQHELNKLRSKMKRMLEIGRE